MPPILRYIALALLVMSGLGAAEGMVRISAPENPYEVGAKSLPAFVRSFRTYQLSGRELQSHYMAQTITNFLDHPDPKSIHTAIFGTSRARVLAPTPFGRTGWINGANNSYNEITYGMLAEAEALHIIFPNLKRIFVEASLLLRRPPPPRFIVEPDHIVYMPLLVPLEPLRDHFADGKEFRQFVATSRKREASGLHSELFSHRRQLHLVNLFENRSAAKKSVPAKKTLAGRDPNGWFSSLPPLSTPPDKQRPPIKEDNVRIRRLRPVPSWFPWDRRFDMWALWGKAHGIEILFFEPPVRSDFYELQLKYGLREHKKDLERISRKYGISYIDLNRPELGYAAKWAMVSDYDHFHTCRGVEAIFTALEEGYKKWQKTGTLIQAIPLSEALNHSRPLPPGCH